MRGAAERLPWLRENWHLLVTALLAATLVPSIRRTGLPTRFDWGIFETYWIGLALQSVFLGVVLCAFGIPFEQGVGPWWNRVRGEKLRLVAAMPLAALLIFLFGTWKGLVLLVDAIALIEFIDRARTGAASKLISVFLPAAYIFIGLIVAFGYTDVIAAMRFNGAADLLVNRADMWLMRGASVSSIARIVLAHLPAGAPSWLSVIYFGMFPQLGVSLLLLSFYEGRARSFQFAGTIIVSYYIGLICFFLVPAVGPCVLRAPHLASSAPVYASENYIASQVAAIRSHTATLVLGADYFIGFPCMHVVQPLIVLWYVRRWRRILIALAAYDCVLVASIILLEEHYVMDVIAGVAVAAAAIALVSVKRLTVELNGAP